METTVDTNGCTFLWIIENVSFLNWFKKGQSITSPVFIADALGETKWRLWFYPNEKKLRNGKMEKFVGIYLRREEDCEGPEKIEVKCEFAFLDKTDKLGNETEMKCEFSKGAKSGYGQFMLHEILFFDEFETFISGDTLSVHCTLFKTDKKHKSNPLFATTVIDVKRSCFLWRIDKPLDLKSDIKNKFDDYLISFDVVLRKDLNKMVVTMLCTNDSLKYMSIDVSIIDSEERREYCNKFKHFFEPLKRNRSAYKFSLLSKRLMENKSRYFPNDVLSLRLEFVLVTSENSDCKKYSDALVKDVVGNKRTRNTQVPNNNLNYRYDDESSKDVQLVTETGIIGAHQKVLTDNSKVFYQLFKTDMKENESKCVNVGFEENTVREMLKYIYTGSLEDLNCDMAGNLLEISNYYEIFSLKGFCSSFLQDNLCQTNACVILLLADQCEDDDLKIAAQNYILWTDEQIFSSQEWKDLTENNLKIAADVMHMKITMGNL